MLCAGTTRGEGWHTLDCNPNNGPNFLAAIPPLPKAVMLVKWDEIELIHGITSFYPWEARQLLIEIRGVLAQGGKLVLEQPDLNYVCDAIAIGSGTVDWLFGDPQFWNPAHMNKWAYSPRSLAELLEACGFSHVLRTSALHHNPTRDFRMEAWV